VPVGVGAVGDAVAVCVAREVGDTVGVGVRVDVGLGVLVSVRVGARSRLLLSLSLSLDDCLEVVRGVLVRVAFVVAVRVADELLAMAEDDLAPDVAVAVDPVDPDWVLVPD
jgi:hypothetical protein